MAQTTIFPTLFDLMGLRWAPAVADLDTLRLRNDEFVVRQRYKDVENRVFDISSTVVDDALRTAPGQRRADLYRSQETIPKIHPNGYKGPGTGLRDSQLQERYDPRNNNPDERYVPSDSREAFRSRIVPPVDHRGGPTGPRSPSTRGTDPIEVVPEIGPIPSPINPSPHGRTPQGSGRVPSATGGPLSDSLPLTQPRAAVDSGVRRSDFAAAPARATPKASSRPATTPRRSPDPGSRPPSTGTSRPTAAPLPPLPGSEPKAPAPATPDDARPKRGLSRLFQRD